MTLFLRYDDFSAMSSTSIEEKLVESMAQFGLKCTFAVTPYFADVGSIVPGGDLRLLPIPRSKRQVLEAGIASGMIEVALHGYSHLCTSRIRSMFEFSNAMPVALQRSLIRAGRECLEDFFGVGVSTFVPPWNLCNDSTLKALGEEGFQCLSAAAPLAFSSTCSTAEIQKLTMSYVPANIDASNAEAVIRLAAKRDREKSLVSLVFHDYDFAESPFCSSNTSVSACLATLARAAREGDCLSVLARELDGAAGRDYERFAANLALQQSIWRTPVRRRLVMSQAHVYWSTPAARKLRRMVNWIP